MGTKLKPGTFDCYANAEPDEPIFVLLARDKHAPALVWLWAVLRELDGEKPEKVQEARQCMLNMVEWATDRGRRTVGVGEAALASVMELIRAANYGVKQPKNDATDVDVVRRFLCTTTVEADATLLAEQRSEGGAT